jgi:hypothetical protein
MKLTDEQIGRAAFTAAIAGTVLAPIHALSRFATADGKEDLQSGVVRAWAEPAAERLSPLLDWAGVDTVYVTYGKLWAPIFLAAVLCAFAVRRRRTPTGGERWGWRLTLIGVVGMTVGVTGSYWTPLLDEFFVMTIPFLLTAMVGATTLGITCCAAASAHARQRSCSPFGSADDRAQQRHRRGRRHAADGVGVRHRRLVAGHSAPRQRTSRLASTSEPHSVQVTADAADDWPRQRRCRHLPLRSRRAVPTAGTSAVRR